MRFLCPDGTHHPPYSCLARGRLCGDSCASVDRFWRISPILMTTGAENRSYHQLAGESVHQRIDAGATMVRRKRSRTSAIAISLVGLLCGLGSTLWQPPPSQAAGTALALDKLVTTHATTRATSVTSPTFTTSQAGELLVA